MARRKGDGWDDEEGGLLGAYAIGGPGLAGLYGLGRSLQEGGRADEGGAPIGSDPWLRAEVRRALARERLPPGIEVEVLEMVVTLRGKIGDQDAEQRALAAARGVPGVAKVHSELARG